MVLQRPESHLSHQPGSQGGTLAPLSRCARQVKVPNLGLVLVPSQGLQWLWGEECRERHADHGPCPLLAWRGRRGILNSLVSVLLCLIKSMGLESPDLTFVTIPPLTRWVALGTGQPH